MEQVGTLSEAAQSPNVTGALQQLMLSRGQSQPMPPTQQDPRQQAQQMLMQRMGTPEQSQQVNQQRQSALQAYQQSLLQPPMGNYTPTEHGLYSWLENMGKTRSPFEAVSRGIGAGGRMLGEQEAARYQNNVAASKAGYDDAVGQDVLDSRDLSNLRMSAASSARGASAGVEKILPLYGKIFNSYSQQAKDMQFADPAERTAWIREQTDSAMSSAVSQFGGAVNPAVLNQLFSMSQSASSSNATPIEPAQRTQAAADNKPSAPLPGMQISPMQQIARDNGAIRLRNSEVTGDLPNWPTTPSEPTQGALLPMRAENSSTSGMSPEQRAKFSQGTPQGEPPFRNAPNEALMKSGAQNMGKVYAADYTAMLDSATAAKEQLDAYSNLEKIDPNTNAFAGVQGYVGTALQGLGIDPNTPIIRDAIKNREANTIIKQMSNAALRGEKGVQTRSDEVRIGDELARTTDPKQAWDFLIKLGKERAKRRVDMLEFADQQATANNGVPLNARAKFVAATLNDPLTQRIGGRIVFRSPTIEAFMRKYPDADVQEATAYWKSLEKSVGAK